MSGIEGQVAQPKILVVDDSPTILSTVGWLLRNEGYDVRVAPDGFTALSIIKNYLPDLIILDIQLEHIDGFELCALIRRDKNFTKTPIVMLSSYTEQKYIDHAYDMGATGYITKPASDSDLLTTVKKALPNNNQLQTTGFA